MYCTGFEYDGRCLSDYGCIVCHISGGADLNTISIGSKISFNTINMIQQNEFRIMSTQYDEPYAFTFEIGKSNCNTNDGTTFSKEEIASIMTWLNRKNYCKFKMIYENNEFSNVYYMGVFNSIDQITYGGDIIGLALTFQANAPFGYYDPIDCELNFSTSNDEITIYDTSDEIGSIYVTDITIECLESGNLSIHNSQDGLKSTVINNCVKGEIITLDGKNKLIKSSVNHLRLYNDFNYNFIKISNRKGSLYDRYANTFTVSLPCNIKFSYSPICKAGLV